MSNIRVDVEYTIKDGTEIKFRSPVDCSQITGLIVYYPGANKNIVSKVFSLSDAHGNNVGDIDHLFAENVVVKVILDVTTGMAFVQNADTNAYLEEQLNKPVTRANLANDALYSPFVNLTSNTYDVTVADVGKTIKGGWNANLNVTLSQANSEPCPFGAEFAVFKYGTTCEVSVTLNGTRCVVNGMSGLYKDVTLRVSDDFGMIALKKVSADNTSGNVWLVTGNVEVV